MEDEVVMRLLVGLVDGLKAQTWIISCKLKNCWRWLNDCKLNFRRDKKIYLLLKFG